MSSFAFHHLQFNTPAPEAAARWYCDSFGPIVGAKGQSDAYNASKASNALSASEQASVANDQEEHGQGDSASSSSCSSTSWPSTNWPGTSWIVQFDTQSPSNCEFRFSAPGDLSPTAAEADTADWIVRNGSIGSTLDHYGWSVPNLDECTTALSRAGCSVIGEPMTIGPSPTGKTLRISFLLDPFGTKFELVQDEDLFGFHHIHLMSPAAEAEFELWQRAFQGEGQVFKGFLPGIRYADFWVLFRESEAALAATKGRILDRLGFLVGDAAEALADIEALGSAAQATPPVAQGSSWEIGSRRAKVALSTGKTGAVTIELVELVDQA